MVLPVNITETLNKAGVIKEVKMQGTVKWFNRIKGFGFITPSEGGVEIFAHFSKILGDGYRNLREGQQVEFELKETPRGPCAENIKIL